VAARGIDVDHVAHVVNYDMPKVAEDFVHRVGRTGRASRSGVASTFASPEEKGDLRKIERALRINMQRFRVKEALPQAVSPSRKLSKPKTKKGSTQRVNPRFPFAFATTPPTSSVGWR
jgi:superfamily II DNA/RNA helicase